MADVHGDSSSPDVKPVQRVAIIPHMSTPSPYRALSAERRLALVLYSIRTNREAREQYIQRLVKRGGGFRATTLKTWAPDRLAREVVRMRAEDSQDELDLLQLMYVDLEPAIQTTFLNAAGVQHENGRMAEELEPPYADAESVKRAAMAVQEHHGTRGLHYLETLVRYSLDGWPGIDGVVAEMETIPAAAPAAHQ